MRRYSMYVAGILLGATAVLSGCKDLSGNSTVQSGVLDPKLYDTPAGVQSRLEGLRTLFGIALNQAIMATGTLTDELTVNSPLDQRSLQELTDAGADADPGLAYAKLQDLRVQADLAARAINTHKLDLPPATRGELYALQGYAEVLLNDLYCSGVPLTTLDISGTIRYQPGSSRDAVYEHAVIVFDSAIALSSDNPPVMTLARVGKGRALLALAQYAAAAQAVSAVADTDRYTNDLILGVPAVLDERVLPTDFGTYSVSDREGHNGLPYRSDTDPRTTVVAFQDAQGFDTYYAPGKYQTSNPTDSVSVVVASGVEARLIQAEANLHQGDVATWLATLNALRTNGTFSTVTRTDPVTGDSVGIDTAWNSGIGGVPGLSPLSDPGAALSGAAAAAARVTTLFDERANWLFLTAHRQGDLRRLLREYPGRSQGQVYPTGLTVAGTPYGVDVTVPIPPSERINPKFSGCLDRQP